MSLFGRLFGPRQQRQEAERAGQIIESALRESREPRKCAEAAASGADMRSSLFSVVDRLEAEMGQLVIAYAEKEGVLMTHPRLTDELRKRPDGEVLDLAIPLCFLTLAATARLNADWPNRVASYRDRQNTDEIISEKASVLTAYIVHNLGVGTEISKEVLKDEREINDEQELAIKVEESCLWYRLIDELAYLNIRNQRSRFMDFFEDNLGRLLALQGAAPGTICGTMSARSEEYGPYREWVLAISTKWPELCSGMLRTSARRSDLNVTFCSPRRLERYFSGV